VVHRLGLAALVAAALSLHAVAQPPVGPSKPAPDARETDWSAYLASRVGGAAEFRLPNGARIDVLELRTDPSTLRGEKIAWEVEWAPKWKEAVGQALFYAAALDGHDGTSVRPGIWLLVKPGEEVDEDYLQLLAVVRELRGRGLDFRLRIQRTDQGFGTPPR
jgi:hypothetical protein